MAKSADAFRTISEVSQWLDTPAHVLRFWESKFSQVKPVKRAGGRRYYRPSDMELLGGIKRLLHEDGMTIKGVQKLLREKGVGHVAALSQPLDDVTAAVRDAMDGRAKKVEASPDTPVAANVSAPVSDAPSAAASPVPVAETNAPAAPVTPVLGMPAANASPAPAGPEAAPDTAPATADAPKDTPAPASLLAAIYARTTPLAEPARAEVAALRQRLKLWLAAEPG